MWPTTEQSKRFQALSYGDKLRVSRALARGCPPAESRLAAATIDLAECYRGQSRLYTMLQGWYALIIVVGFGYLTVSNVLTGSYLLLIPFGLVLITGTAILIINPATRPANIGRSAVATRQAFPQVNV